MKYLLLYNINKLVNVHVLFPVEFMTTEKSYPLLLLTVDTHISDKNGNTYVIDWHWNISYVYFSSTED